MPSFRAKRLRLRSTGVIVLLSLGGLSAIAPPAADAFVIRGRPWPDGAVAYFSSGAPRAVAALDSAARAWNRARVGVQFRRSPLVLADVVVSGGGARCAGRAAVGYSELLPTRIDIGRCSPTLMKLRMAHELGHVLGLSHERQRCALMNPISASDGTPNRCARRSLAYWLKHPLTSDDIRGARALRALADAAATAPSH